MKPRRLEVADVFREHAAAYLRENRISIDQKRVLKDISVCRTAALGGHVKRCDRCGHEEFFYKSCANRHCPKCQGTDRAKWLEARAKELLETQYFHVVFTVVHDLGPIALANKRLIYGLLFRAASETLLKVARDPRHLGAELGFLAVLHTWGQQMELHPHVHCVVPGGGISPDGTKWISSRKGFFLPVRVLSRVFRGKFLDFLRKAFAEGKLRLEGKLSDLRDPARWEAEIKRLKRSEWVVYAKPPFGGPRQVLKYLARYTHRVAISNERLISMADGKVTFRWKDYSSGQAQRTMTLDASEFIRRFLLHVLPTGFQRLRHYGFLANRARKEKLALCRRLLPQPERPPASPSQGNDSSQLEVTEHDSAQRCPACKKGQLLLVAFIEPDWQAAEKALNPRTNDTS